MKGGEEQKKKKLGRIVRKSEGGAERSRAMSRKRERERWHRKGKEGVGRRNRMRDNIELDKKGEGKKNLI